MTTPIRARVRPRLAPRSSLRSAARRGFTLIELLVVIAVIMLLAALTMSVIGRAIRQAERTQCASNLHQIHLMAVTYAKDYRNRLPHLDPGTHSLWIAHQGIRDIVQRYRFEPKAFYCPSNTWDLIHKSFSTNQWAMWSVVGGGPLVRFGYIHLSRRKAYVGTLHGDVELVRKLTDHNPSQTPYYVDFLSLNNPDCEAHESGANVLMLDGRVNWRPQSAVALHYSRKADTMMPYSEFHW